MWGCLDQKSRRKSSILSSSYCSVDGLRRMLWRRGLKRPLIQLSVSYTQLKTLHRSARFRGSRGLRDWHAQKAAQQVEAHQDRGSVAVGLADLGRRSVLTERRCVGCVAKGTACGSSQGLSDCDLRNKLRTCSPTNKSFLNQFFYFIIWTSKSAYGTSVARRSQ